MTNNIKTSDLSTVKVGDTVRFRCGGEATIRHITDYKDEFQRCWLEFEGFKDLCNRWFYWGRSASTPLIDITHINGSEIL